MNKKTYLKRIITTGFFIALATLAIQTGSVSAQGDFCNRVQDWTEFGGYSLSQCPNGLGFPAINAYNNKTILGERSREWEFALVRLKDASSNSAPRFGFSNNQTLNTNQQAQSYIYIHNSGNPNCNTENERELSRKGCPRSTIAKNVRLKIVSGLSRNSSGDYVSAPGTTHRITYEISSNNTTPRTIRDSFVITTQPGKQVKLKMDAADENFAEICRNHSPAEEAGDRECLDNPKPRQAFNPAQLFGDGLLISSSYAGSGNTTDLFASEGYRVYVYNTFEVEDAPAVARCENLTLIKERVDTERNTATFRVDLTPDNRNFRDALRSSMSGGGTSSVDLGSNRSENDVRINVFGWTEESTLNVKVNGQAADCQASFPFRGEGGGDDICRVLNMEERFLDNANRIRRIRFTTEPNNRDFHGSNMTVTRLGGTGTSTKEYVAPFLGLFGEHSTDITFNDWNETSQFRISVNGQPSCTKTINFSLPSNVCTDLRITDRRKIGDSVRVDFAVTPGTFDLNRNPITYSVVSGRTDTLTVIRESATRLTVSGFAENTVLNFFVSGYSADCNEPLSFKDFVDKLCRDLTMSPDKYNYERNSRPSFTVSPTPSGFTGPFTYTVRNEDGSQRERVVTSSRTFTPTRALDGTQTVHVDVDSSLVEPGRTCRDQAESELPPEGERCPSIRIIRAETSERGYIPRVGESIKLGLAGFGEYEGNVIWRSNNAGVSFVTRSGENAQGLKTSVENEVIVRVSPTARLDRGTRITVEAEDPSAYRDCKDNIITEDKPGDKPTTILKEIIGPLGNPKNAVVRDGQEVTYKVTVSVRDTSFFRGIPKSVKIYDNAAIIRGSNRELEPNSGRLLIKPGSIKFEGSRDIEPGNNPEAIFNLNEGFTINNFGDDNNDFVSITYTAAVDSALDGEKCKNLKSDCGERFTNIASDSFGQKDSTNILVVCPFILSRGFGDVFLEKEFNFGVDVATCSNRTSSEGPIFKPTPEAEQGAPVTGGTGDLTAPTHRVCEKSGSATQGILEGYQDNIKGFSSSVCEVAMQNSEKWQKDNIVKNIKANVDRVAKGNTTLQNVSTISNLTDESLKTYDSGNPNPKNKVYRKQGNLTIGSGEAVKVSGQAKTIIVENGDLLINSNIQYDSNDKKSVIAFLVINGDIIFGENVTNVVGIYASVRTPESTKGGTIDREAGGTGDFTIFGSVYGDIEPLFRTVSETTTGDLTRDRGAVTVLYDGRIVNNTPPGLNDVVKFNQFQNSSRVTVDGRELYE